MIRTVQQAIEIQHRRHKAGKKGIAKAVRNFFLKHDPKDYAENISRLPVTWPETKANAAEEVS